MGTHRDYDYSSRKKSLQIIIVLMLVLVVSPLSAFKAGTHAVLSYDIAKQLPVNSLVKEAMLRHPHIAAWGSTGPDLPASSIGITIDHAPWFEKYHYEKVGSFARKMLQIALDNRDYQQIAWAAGWLTHVIGDLYCHGVFVNPDPEVDGVYLADPDTKTMHGFLEAYADKVMYTDRSDPRRSYNVQHMQETFANFDTTAIAELMARASHEVHGSSPTQENIDDWVWFFKKIYLNTGIAGGTNFVYDNTYQEAMEELQKESGIIDYGRWAHLTRKERLDLAYEEAMATSVRLLTEAERQNYYNFSDAWNLDAYHLDNRAIGTLTVTIRTANERFAGTDDDVYFGLIRDDGETWRSPVLQKGSGLLGLGEIILNDFERGSCETYYIFVDGFDFPINRINEVFLEKDSDGISGGWKIDSLTVSINGRTYFDGKVNRWLEEDELFWSAPIMNVPPRNIPVYIKLNPDVINDKITLNASIVSTGAPAYAGPATLSVQHKNGDVDSYIIQIGGNGNYVKMVSLSPDDRIQAHIYHPRPENPEEIFIGQTEWMYPKVPYEDITISADAFNDSITGTVGGSYSGPIEILVRDTEEAVDDRTFWTQARSGVFSLAVPIGGTDGITAWSFCEQVRLPKGDYYIMPDIDSLEISCSHPNHDTLLGTVTNKGAYPAAAYMGNVFLAQCGSSDVLALTQTTLSTSSTVPLLSKSVTRSPLPQTALKSEFSFNSTPIILDLGYSVWIEHEGIKKYFTHDPMEQVEQEAKKPVQLAVTSPVSDMVNPVVHTMHQAFDLQQTALSQTSSSVSSQQAAPMNMMMANSPSMWEGAWDTSIGPMVLYQTGCTVTGICSEDAHIIEGTISSSRLVGIVKREYDTMGEFDFSTSANGQSFTGTLRYADEQWPEYVEGILVSPLERAGIKANPKNLEGVWSTDQGVMVLDEQSGSYYGICGPEKYIMEGRLFSNTLKGSFYSPGTIEKSTFSLSFNQDLTYFEGYLEQEDEELYWVGHRMP